ncbi:MAG: glycosyltransferase [Candidatus Altiarchaeales archaeon]|nr:glycosyltransferase [Candidatus Altiarchaeales archaeon]MBD3415517.1 glycosyltransferase [Candidatus Altiarchaeales archaeon]
MLNHVHKYLSSQGGVETYLKSVAAAQSTHSTVRISTLEGCGSDIPGVDVVEYPLLDDLEALPLQETGDIVHLHNVLPAGRPRYPTVYHLHNHDPYCPSGTKYYPRIERECVIKMSPFKCAYHHLVDGCGSRRPHRVLGNIRESSRENRTLRDSGVHVIANSDYVRGNLLKTGFPEDRLHTVHYGIAGPPLQDAGADHDFNSKKMLFAGRLVAHKGVGLLLDVMAALGEDVTLDVAGDGWHGESLRAKGRTLGLGDRVSWHGWCESGKMAELYEEASLVVFPSLWPEPAGLVTLEAYSHGRPVIASNIGGIPEHIVDGETGVLTPPGDVDAWAENIASLLSNPTELRKMGGEARSLYEREYTMEAHMRNLNEVYRLAGGLI